LSIKKQFIEKESFLSIPKSTLASLCEKKHVSLLIVRDIIFPIMNEIFHGKNVSEFPQENSPTKRGIKFPTEDVLISERSLHVQHIWMRTALIKSNDRSNEYLRKENLTSFFTARCKGALN